MRRKALDVQRWRRAPSQRALHGGTKGCQQDCKPACLSRLCTSRKRATLSLPPFLTVHFPSPLYFQTVRQSSNFLHWIPHPDHDELTALVGRWLQHSRSCQEHTIAACTPPLAFLPFLTTGQQTHRTYRDLAQKQQPNQPDCST